MIRYALKCTEGHGFESWFQSAEAFDTLHGKGLVACPDCGSSSVEKVLMAPQVQAARKKAGPPALSAPPKTDQEKALAALKAHVEENSDYVGLQFADEARKMHDGEAPTRSIHGEAKIEDAKKLIEDGIPVAPLPFRPRNKVN